MIWYQREPTLEEILSDPITKAMMQADRVEPQELAAMVRRIACARTGAMKGGKPGQGIEFKSTNFRS
jgi:hypothetical protein